MVRRNNVKSRELRTTIGLKMSTKNRLDRYRSPGQSYDGFVRQLLSLWKEVQKESLAFRSSVGEKQSANDN